MVVAHSFPLLLHLCHLCAPEWCQVSIVRGETLSVVVDIHRAIRTLLSESIYQQSTLTG